VHIRTASSIDSDIIHQVHLSAFPDEENAQVAKIALDLLVEKTQPKTVSLVAEMDGKIVGHICFSPTYVESNNEFLGYILAPLAILPKYQKQGVGSRLIQEGLMQLKAQNTQIVFVYGDPAYYGKFGFSVEVAEGYNVPYKLKYPFGWQALTLNEKKIEKPVAITCVEPLNNQTLW
jgi:putative acetyltransferase